MYGGLIPIRSAYINLQDDFDPLPYDLEFTGDTTLYDVFRKILDLYPRQMMFFDTNRCINFVQQNLQWNEPWNSVDIRAREIYDLVLEESWSVNYSNASNYVVVWGRDNTCHSYYYITEFMTYCPHCNKKFAYDGRPNNRSCPNCGHEMQAIFDNSDKLQQLSLL